METYYCIHGATNNGNGASSAEAATPGGVGAFNDAMAVLDGTEIGLPVSGPYAVIFKTQHLGSDITLTRSTDMTIRYGVGAANRITYIFDDGNSWPGESGTLTLQFTSGILLSVDGTADRSGNPFADLICRRQYNFVIDMAYLSSATRINYVHDGILSGVYFSISSRASSGQHRFGVHSRKYTCPSLLGCKQDVVEGLGIQYYSSLANASTTSPSGMIVDGHVFNIFYNDQFGSYHVLMPDSITRTGYGRCSNVSIVVDSLSAIPYTIDCHIDGLTYPASLSVNIGINIIASRIKNTGQAESFGFQFVSNSAQSFWRGGQLFPTLNAILPDSVTPWSIRVDTQNIVEGIESRVLDHTQYYDQPAAQKKLAMHLLVPDSYGVPTGLDWFATFTYEKTDGTMVTLSTCSPDNLVASAAGWSALSYSSIQYTAYKMEVTTPDQIKQDSIIAVSFYTKRRPINANEYYFVDPELEIGVV